MINPQTSWLRYSLILFVLVSSTAAGQSAVTDIDMKSMYCTRIQVNLKNGLQPMVQYFESVMPKSPELKEMRNELNRIERDVKRMQDYLMTRARIVGASAYSQSVMVAANRGDSDIATQRRCVEECGDTSNKDGTPNFAKVDACQAGCKRKIGDVLSRMQSCDKVDWLPF
jgi:hypothetical protein